ncbi:MAG: copper oxidase [Ferruginibacter sp.]|nr:copper oxidase [Ferruginibacter sp.]
MLAIVLLFTGATSFAQTKNAKKQHHVVAKQKFTCSMHPEVVRSKPGKCPKCNMALVPVKKKAHTKMQPVDKMKM